MREKIKIGKPIVVEGKYDKIALSQIIEGNIFTTGGFGVFNSKEKQMLLRRLAEERGLILLTDSDGGGRQIRAFLQEILPKDKLIQLYIPKIAGKEKRKSEPSKEGTLGVEGMEAQLIHDLLLPFSSEEGSDAALRVREISENPLSKVDFFIDGLTGAENSSQKRDALAAKFSLPCGMTPKALLEALKVVATYEEYLAAVGRER